MRAIVTTKAFKKDVKRMLKRRKAFEKIEIIMRALAKGQTLPARCRDHKLTGDYALHRECHIEPDWLLIYRFEPHTIIFERTGTHADLFKK